MNKTRTVVIGGGTGIYPVVSALRQLPTYCSTIINASDSGGSTGRIRDEFGFPPVGDLRQSLAALADPASQHWIRQLLLYRFDKGTGLTGHNLGNLILTALQDMTGNTTNALATAATVFRINGRVIPVSDTAVELQVTYDDGTVVKGEAALDDHLHTPHTKIIRAELLPTVPLNPAAAAAIKDADFIIIGPGDYYASIQSVLLMEGIAEAFAKSTAKILYFVNLMSRATQTKDMTAREHVKGIEDSIGKTVDFTVLNTAPVSESLLKAYALADEYPVIDDLGNSNGVIRKPLINPLTEMTQSESDSVQRSFLRHDETKILEVLRSVYQ